MADSTIIKTVTGTGNAQVVELGIVPSAIEIINKVNGKSMRWVAGMNDGHAIVDSLATTAPAQTLATVGGVTPYAGVASASPGITLGSNSSVNIASNALAVIAYR